MNRSHEDQDVADHDAEPQSETDDRVIATAFRWSLAVILAVVLLIGLGFGLRHYLQPRQETVQADARADLASLLQADAAPAAPTLRFTDITESAGIDFVQQNGATGERLLPETMGGGVAFFDYDNDADPDLLLVDSGPWSESSGPSADWSGALRLYRNEGDGRFTEVSAEVGLAGTPGYGMGVAIGDYDSDGWNDVFMTAVGSNRLFRNQQGRFVEVTAQAGVAGDAQRWSSSAGFFDYDGDGWLDLFVVNYVDWSRQRDFEVDYRLDGIGRAYGPPSNFPGTQNYLYRNLGNGRFREVGVEAGIHVTQPGSDAAVGKGLAMISEDLDGDGWVDVVVANDTVRNFVFRNLGQGRFEEVGEDWGLGYDRNGMATGAMGIDLGSVWGDGSQAIAIGNFANEMTSFYVSQDGLGAATAMQFADEAIVSGIGPGSRLALTFGLLFLDIDLDGRLDLLQVNGHVENEIARVQASQQYRQPAQLFWNCGSACAAPMMELPAKNLGALAEPMVGRGLAAADIDADGDLDLILTQIAGAPKLLRNDTSNTGHWLKLRLQGRAPNLDAIGARVELHAAGQVQRRHISRNRSYLSQVDLPLSFGLGPASAIDGISIRWPDGSKQQLGALQVDRLHRIEQPAAIP